jgi:hypothetical protein
MHWIEIIFDIENINKCEFLSLTCVQRMFAFLALFPFIICRRTNHLTLIEWNQATLAFEEMNWMVSSEFQNQYLMFCGWKCEKVWILWLLQICKFFHCNTSVWWIFGIKYEGKCNKRIKMWYCKKCELI